MDLYQVGERQSVTVIQMFEIHSASSDGVSLLIWLICGCCLQSVSSFFQGLRLSRFGNDPTVCAAPKSSSFSAFRNKRRSYSSTTGSSVSSGQKTTQLESFLPTSLFSFVYLYLYGWMIGRIWGIAYIHFTAVKCC